MGEAQRRGTFEQRKAQSIARKEEQQAAAEQAERDRLAAMSPEERSAEAKSRHRARMVLATAAGIAAGALPPEED